MSAGEVARGRAGVSTIEVLAVLAIALVPRLLGLDHTPQVDEFNHLLAARSLLEGEGLAINGGEPYDRAWLFTWIVAGFVRVFGESLVVARLPAVIFGTALVVGVFAWTRRHAGRTAAWAAALLLAIHPLAIYVSQLTRFYTLHALLFWAAAAGFYAAAYGTGGRARRAGLAVLGTVALLGALHLQVTTLIGAAGLAVWALAMPLRAPIVERLRRPRGWLWLAGAAVFAVMLAGIGRDALASGWALFRYADPWAEWSRDYPEFYHRLFVGEIPTLWTLLPLLALAALVHRPRPAALCAIVFGVIFLGHSMAAWKADRYIFYGLPALFVLAGTGMAATLPAIVRMLEALHARTRSRVPVRAVRVGGLGLVVLFAAAGNDGLVYAVRMATLDDTEWRIAGVQYRGEPDWEGARAALAPYVRASDVLVSSSDLKPFYYFEGADYVTNLNEWRAWAEGGQEFGLSRKVRVPMFVRPESALRIMECHESGVVVAEEAHWRNTAWGVPVATSLVFEQHATPIELPPGSRLRAYYWRRPPAAESSPSCPPGAPGSYAQADP